MTHSQPNINSHLGRLGESAPLACAISHVAWCPWKCCWEDVILLSCVITEQFVCSQTSSRFSFQQLTQGTASQSCTHPLEWATDAAVVVIVVPVADDGTGAGGVECRRCRRAGDGQPWGGYSHHACAGLYCLTLTLRISECCDFVVACNTCKYLMSSFSLTLLVVVVLLKM